MEYDTIAVTVYIGLLPNSGLDPHRMRTVQVQEAREMLGKNVVSVEEKPSHPAYEELKTRMTSRIGLLPDV